MTEKQKMILRLLKLKKRTLDKMTDPLLDYWEARRQIYDAKKDINQDPDEEDPLRRRIVLAA